MCEQNLSKRILDVARYKHCRWEKEKHENMAKNQLFYESWVTHRHGEGESFYRSPWHRSGGGEWSQPFPVEMVGNNSEIGGTEVLLGQFWKRRRRGGERRHRGNELLGEEDPPHPGP
jgi:hypothetical protein